MLALKIRTKEIVKNGNKTKETPALKNEMQRFLVLNWRRRRRLIELTDEELWKEKELKELSRRPTYIAQNFCDPWCKKQKRRP